MSFVWKAVIALALVLPLGGYAAGAYVANGDDRPETRATIQLKDANDDGAGTHRARERQNRGHGDEGEGDDDAEDEIERVNPDPEDVDDDAADRREDRRDNRRDRREERRADDGHSRNGNGEDGALG